MPKHTELMKFCEYSRSRLLLDLRKLNFLRNSLTSESQILFVVSLGRGNQSLYKYSRSHDQDGRHAHGKNLKKSSLELVDRFH